MRVPLILVSVLFAACAAPGPTKGPAGPVTTSAADTHAAPTPSGAPGQTTTSPSAGGAWAALHWSAPALMPTSETIADLTPWYEGSVAVGSFQAQPNDGRAAAWTSSDWRTWTRTLLDIPAAGSSSIEHVLGLRSGLVAIGTSGALRCVPPEGAGQVCDPLRVAIWTSADGQRWRQIATPPTFSGATISGVASNGQLLVLVGSTGWNQARIWISPDGATWQRADLPAGVFADAHFGWVAAEPGGFVITGQIGGAKPACCVSGGGLSTPAAWFSADGRTWTAALVDGAAAVADGRIGRTFVGEAGLVAWSSPGVSPGWASADGRRWSALPEQSGYPVVPQASDGIRIVGESYVAGDRIGFWSSVDGRTWRTLVDAGDPTQAPAWSGPGVATADSMFVFADGVGLVGRNGTDRQPVWFAPAVPGS